MSDRVYICLVLLEEEKGLSIYGKIREIIKKRFWKI